MELGFITSFEPSRTDVAVSKIDGRRTLPVMTRFERAKLLAQRAEQIAAGGPITFRNEAKLDNPVEIAQEELRLKVIPFLIVRTLPDGTTEKWNAKDMLY
jgi:DNA-directed RNA polymerase I, II, and III subunit RPABC2